VRELEIGILMDSNVAKSLVLWLNDRIKVAEEMKQTANIRGGSEVKK